MASIFKFLKGSYQYANRWRQTLINKVDENTSIIDLVAERGAITQEGSIIKSEDFNLIQQNGVIYSEPKYDTGFGVGVDGYILSDFSMAQELFKGLKLKLFIDTENLYDSPQIQINESKYILKKYSINEGKVDVGKGELKENNTYNIIYDGNDFIVENLLQTATEDTAGIVTLEQIYETGLPFRGQFPYEDKILTYQEAMELSDGIYSIESTKHFNCLNIPQQGRNISAAGILKKKTTDMLMTASATKQTTLEYIPHNYNSGVTSISMIFWNNATEMSKNLNTSAEASGLWNVDVGWSDFNLVFPGYVKLGNGLMIQWFVVSTNAATGANGTLVTFPVAFDNICLIASSNDGGNGVHVTAIGAFTKYNCKVWAREVTGGTFTNASVIVTAIGY